MQPILNKAGINHPMYHRNHRARMNVKPAKVAAQCARSAGTPHPL